MRLSEHASKLLFNRSDINTPPGILIEPDAVRAPDFPTPWFVKSQVLAGGRGKAGGVLRVDDPAGLPAAADALFALKIKGAAPPCLRIEPAVDIAKEFYLSLAVSRARNSLSLTVGPGGVDVEADPDALLIQDIRLPHGPSPHQLRAAFFHLGLDKALFKPFAALAQKLYAAVRQNALLLAEINPLVLTGGGEFLALDGKVEIDDNAAAVRPDLEAHYDPRFENTEEDRARRAGLSFVKLSGRIGLMVNGAGLAMAAMDLLNLSGLPAANFLDLGGGADVKRMRAALSLLFADNDVEAVFINLFGGVLSCRKAAEAFRDVLDGKPPAKPVTVRLSGNDAAEGLEILRGLNLPGLRIVPDMDQAITALAAISRKEKTTPRIDIAATAATRQKRATARKRPRTGPSLLDLNADSVVCIQGVTGKTATLHAKLMRDYGVKPACGVTPFKGGQVHEGIPVYNSVLEAAAEHDIDVSVIFVPPAFAPDAILEAADAEIPVAVCITDGVAQQDMLAVLPAVNPEKTVLIGPNTPGVIIPGQIKAGIMPAAPYTPGDTAVFSRSGTLTYEACDRLSAAGIGQALCAGVGGDPFIGTGFVELAEMVRDDDRVKTVLVLGEIGGAAEEDLADYVAATNYPKPVIAFVAGVTAPPGRRLGHAGAILEHENGVADKLARLENAGITVCGDLGEIAEKTKKT